MKTWIRVGVLLIGISIFLYVRDPYRRLEGHWHLSTISEGGPYRGLATFDFHEYYGILQNMSLNNGGLSMFFNRIGNSLNITAGECFDQYYSYNISGDSLKIYTLDGSLAYVGCKSNYGSCDLQKDYFLHTYADIDLAITSDTSDQLKFQDSRLVNGIVIAENFNNGLVSYRKREVILDSLLQEMKQEDIIWSEDFTERQFLIFADRKTNPLTIDSICLSLIDEGIEKVFLVRRSDTDLNSSFNMFLKQYLPECYAVYDESLERYVYNNTVVSASYIDGEIEFMKKVFKEYDYPVGETQGRVALELLIDEEGTLLRTGISKQHKEDYSKVDQSLVEFISKIEKWNPGECEGKKVLSTLTLALQVCQ